LKEGYVHSLIATCLADPALLAQLSARREGKESPSDELHINAQQLDLEGIRLTAGFITKTRHNPLRKTIPWTLKTLKVTGLEILVFADYTGPFLARRKQGPLNEGERTRSFVEYLLSWLDPKDAAHRLVHDIASHETLIQEIRQAVVVDQKWKPVDSDCVSEDCIPHVRGILRINKTSCNPQKAIGFLKGETDKLSSLERKDYYFCYWRKDQSPSVQLLELDLVSAVLLSQINGQRTIREITFNVNNMYGLGVKPGLLVETFQEVATHGLVNLKKQ
jgi:hypothetical protein